MADLVGCSRQATGRSSPVTGAPCQTASCQLAAGFDEIGRRLRACRPDLLVVVSPDHWVNFFISNLPAVCIGIGDEHDGPPEPFMRRFFRISGSRATRRSAAICWTPRSTSDFEPALSHRLKLDHGTCIPLWRIGIEL